MRALSALALFVLNALAATPASAQRAGTLLASERISDAPQDMQAWRIRYLGTNDRGSIEEMTGVVVAPSGMPSRMGRPVLAWAHGTWGVDDKCTPSNSDNFF